jgi:hypothetical protein
MDLLFKRYASPFLFMDGMIQTSRFSEFVSEFVRTINAENEEQTNWDFYLHKVQEGTFNDFVAEMEETKRLQNVSAQSIESSVQTAMDILNNFNPTKEGGET